MEIEQRIEAFSKLGELIRIAVEERDERDAGAYSIMINGFRKKLEQAEMVNPWFIQPFVKKAMEGVAILLELDSLKKWIKKYQPVYGDGSLQVAVVMAGNIPAVGFHDFLSVLMAGHSIQIKLSSDDNIIIPALAEMLIGIEPGFRKRIAFVEDKIHDFNAVIATGSNNTARYFDYYFGRFPHIIRRNRNAVAVLTGKELPDTFNRLSEDIFLYYGLGCRSVSKIFAPFDFDIRTLFPYFEHYNWIGDQNKYRNNYDYNKSIFLVNGEKHYDNGFALLKESAGLASPVSVIESVA